MIAANMAWKPPPPSRRRPFTLGYGPIVLILLVLLAARAAAHDGGDDGHEEEPRSTITTTTRVTMTVTTRLAHRPTLAAAAHAGYALQGCYSRPVGSESALEGATAPVNASRAGALTVPGCLEACAGASAPRRAAGGKSDPYGFVTVGEGRNCYCGVTLSTAAVRVGDGNCTAPCAGDVRAACGGRGHVAVYTLADAAAVSAFAGTGAGDPGFIGIKSDNPGPGPGPEKPQEQQQGEPMRAPPAAIAVGSLAGAAAVSGLAFLAWKLCARRRRRQKKKQLDKGKGKEESDGGLERREPTLPVLLEGTENHHHHHQQQQQQQQRSDLDDFLAGRGGPHHPHPPQLAEVSPVSSLSSMALHTPATTRSLEPRPSGDSFVVTGAARQRDMTTHVRFADGPAVVTVAASPTSPTTHGGGSGVRHRRMLSASKPAAADGWSAINTVITDGRLAATPTRDTFSPGGSGSGSWSPAATPAAVSATSAIQNPALQYQAYQPPPPPQQQQQQQPVSAWSPDSSNASPSPPQPTAGSALGGRAWHRRRLSSPLGPPAGGSGSSATSSQERLVPEPLRVGAGQQQQQQQQAGQVENESPVLPGGGHQHAAGGGSASKKAE
ncbi:hypothetical protein RB594_005028 [Gaeumannomyces avenae]